VPADGYQAKTGSVVMDSLCFNASQMVYSLVKIVVVASSAPSGVLNMGVYVRVLFERSL
jgi:hypothetical protein